MKLSKNYFFEFSGMPKAGKTTTIEGLRHFYKRMGFKVRNFSGHDRRVEIDKSNPRELNIVLASRAVEYLMTYSVNTQEPTIHFMDRGIFDRSVFINIEQLRGNISDTEADILKNYLLMEKNCKLLDGVFVFSVPTETSMKREYDKSLIKVPGRVMNESYLREFQQILAATYEKEKNRFKYIEWVTTENDTPRQTGLNIARKIWQIIGGDIHEVPIF